MRSWSRSVASRRDRWIARWRTSSSSGSTSSINGRDAAPLATTERGKQPSSALAPDGPWPYLPWLVPVIAVLGARLVVTDLAYLLRSGRIMLDSHAVLRMDVFTYTIYGQPWLNQQWGASVLLSAWYAPFGWRGLVVLQAAIVGACFGATYRCCVSRGASKPVSAVATLICFAVVATLPGALALRPQLFAL